jgi:hypothetical protein
MQDDDMAFLLGGGVFVSFVGITRILRRGLEFIETHKMRGSKHGNNRGKKRHSAGSRRLLAQGIKSLGEAKLILRYFISIVNTF